jgi:5-methyltetrahydrofolate--homocysteine methyltransferase
VRSEAVPLDIDRPTPPFWGTKILKDEISLEDLFWHMDLQALIAGQWQFRKPKDQTREEYDAFLADKVHPILAEWKAKILTGEWLEPRATAHVS